MSEPSSTAPDRKRVIHTDGQLRTVAELLALGEGRALVYATLLFEPGEIVAVEIADDNGHGSSIARARVACALSIGDELTMEIDWLDEKIPDSTKQ